LVKTILRVVTLDDLRWKRGRFYIDEKKGFKMKKRWDFEFGGMEGFSSHNDQRGTQ